MRSILKIKLKWQKWVESNQLVCFSKCQNTPLKYFPLSFGKKRSSWKWLGESLRNKRPVKLGATLTANCQSPRSTFPALSKRAWNIHETTSFSNQQGEAARETKQRGRTRDKKQTKIEDEPERREGRREQRQSKHRVEKRKGEGGRERTETTADILPS